ncbi:protein DMP4 [Sesamum angolense]|uniref:Protein DMP4 n=1 Tax=Sesamum angolense TaxID=2727404 RepID=A0AAE1XFC1_9LAMI|nr:protein DMP4 [Sesamum angolense]
MTTNHLKKSLNKMCPYCSTKTCRKYREMPSNKPLVRHLKARHTWPTFCHRLSACFSTSVPIFSNQGECDTASQSLTAGLVALCGLSCILLSFTDSIKDQKGNISYGFAIPCELFLSCTVSWDKGGVHNTTGRDWSSLHKTETEKDQNSSKIWVYRRTQWQTCSCFVLGGTTAVTFLVADGGLRFVETAEEMRSKEVARRGVTKIAG